MKLIINGKQEDIQEESVSVTDLLRIKEVKTPDMVSVQLNGEFISKNNFSDTMIQEDNEIDFLYFMGGGNGFF